MTTSAATEDINDVFDAIAFSEGSIVQEAFDEGLKKGITEAEEEGYHLGFHKGVEFGEEIGYYLGVVNTLLRLHENQQFDLSDKIVRLLYKLKPLLTSFPAFNCPDTDILKLKVEIKSLFHRLCSLLKFDGTLPAKGLSF